MWCFYIGFSRSFSCRVTQSDIVDMDKPPPQPLLPAGPVNPLEFFDRIDRNSSGEISRADFVSQGAGSGFGETEDELGAIFDMMDIRYVI